jgi:hypothetical protein
LVISATLNDVPPVEDISKAEQPLLKAHGMKNKLNNVEIASIRKFRHCHNAARYYASNYIVWLYSSQATSTAEASHQMCQTNIIEYPLSNQSKEDTRNANGMQKTSQWS